jgi:acetolactate synthase I/II/III large subunit
VTQVFQAIARALSDEGVDTVFCVMGDGNLDLLAELADRCDVRLVHARHEQGAVAMADGYARRSGRLGVASVTHGPGLTQTGTSLKVAAARGSQLLLLAGDTPTGNAQHIQSFEQAPFATAVGATPVPLRTPASWAADLREALRRAASGPVVFNMPTDHQLAPAAGPEPDPERGTVHAAPVASGLDELLAELQRAQRPIVLAGRGAIEAEAELAALAERLGALVVTTLGARGLLNAEPAHVGLVGGLGHEAAMEAVGRADCVLAVGASLNSWSTKSGALLAGKRVLRIDRDREALRGPVAADLALAGDAAATLAALLERLPPRPPAPAPSGGTPAREPDPWRDEPDAVDPRRALAAIEAALPSERTIVLDGGHFFTFGCAALTAPSPQRFIVSCDFATVGQGLAMAIGASAAAPGRRTTLIAGDGGFLMSVAELDTAVRCGLPLDVVVLNDGAYGQEVHSLAAKGLSTAHAEFAVPDLGALARGFGAEGHRLRTAAELERLEELLTAPGGPRVIDVRINPDVVSPAAEEIFRAVREGVGATATTTS